MSHKRELKKVLDKLEKQKYKSERRIDVLQRQIINLNQLIGEVKNELFKQEIPNE